MAQCGEPGAGGRNETACQSPGFCRTDWISFTTTALVVLAVYLWTLAPEVTLGFSGIFSTAALCGGVPHPPGYPLATLWEWLFIKLLPFGNIAWRVAISSAVAGALACGLIALVVSRLGRGLLFEAHGVRARHATGFRIICGYVAGAIFGFNGAFWGRAVIADVWTLSILLFCLVLSLLLRWSYTPERKRYLYSACFAYGLTLTNSQIMLAAAPAIPFLVLAANREVARDMFIGGAIIFIAGVVDRFTPVWPRMLAQPEGNQGALFVVHFLTGIVIAAWSIILIAKTRRALTSWKTLFGCAALFIMGLLPYLYLPVISMTNPPMNWGYTRTAGGFWHVISRGQYAAIQPPGELREFARQVQTYAQVSAAEFGWPYLIMAAIPFAFIRRVPRSERAWLLCSLPMFAGLMLLVIAVLNPTGHSGLRMIKVFLSASYVLLAVWAGCGLIMTAQFVVKRRDCHRGDSRV
jgi:hypothetical protein